MIQQGSFPQLERILESIHAANPLSSSDDIDNQDEIQGGEDSDGNRLLSLPGIRGECQVEMWSDKLLQLTSTEEDQHSPLISNPDDGQSKDDETSAKSCDDVTGAPVYRQTFVFSATLTLPSSERAHTYGQTKVVDLTSSTQLITKDNDVLVVKDGAKNEVSRLPPGLSLEIISCTQKHKDSHLYAYLLTTEQGHSGPCLIFCNSIVGVKRVGVTLQMLGLPVRMLHANMPQVSNVNNLLLVCSSDEENEFT
jgi:ATP-dependent RNA helicase DDX24/MAK5